MKSLGKSRQKRGNVEDVKKYCTYMRKTLRGGNIEVLCKEKERKKPHSGYIPENQGAIGRSSIRSEERRITKVVASGQSRNLGLCLHICMRPCVVEDKEGGKNSIQKGIAFGYLNLGLHAMRAFDTHFINCQLFILTKNTTEHTYNGINRIDTIRLRYRPLKHRNFYLFQF